MRDPNNERAMKGSLEGVVQPSKWGKMLQNIDLQPIEVSKERPGPAASPTPNVDLINMYMEQIKKYNNMIESGIPLTPVEEAHFQQLKRLLGK